MPLGYPSLIKMFLMKPSGKILQVIRDTVCVIRDTVTEFQAFVSRVNIGNPISIICVQECV